MAEAREGLLQRARHRRCKFGLRDGFAFSSAWNLPAPATVLMPLAVSLLGKQKNILFNVQAIAPPAACEQGRYPGKSRYRCLAFWEARLECLFRLSARCRKGQWAHLAQR